MKRAYNPNDIVGRVKRHMKPRTTALADLAAGRIERKRRKRLR